MSLKFSNRDISLFIQDSLRYPFWYFGSDGVTAFDPEDTNSTGLPLSS